MTHAAAAAEPTGCTRERSPVAGSNPKGTPVIIGCAVAMLVGASLPIVETAEKSRIAGRCRAPALASATSASAPVTDTAVPEAAQAPGRLRPGPSAPVGTDP
jgi:hypothetical protein